ncbi:probable cationic amino acid transporter [Cydia strobilella]|uniref:probable cationic amino acid transporter n=1 Tax=Cydia strobilella TaxID=1100964 RepID=UPI0030053A70
MLCADDLASEDKKDDFYIALNSTLKNIRKQDIVIVMGDLNAKVGANNDAYQRHMGRHGLGVRNENGERFLEFCLENDLTIGGTLFIHGEHHNYTWNSPDGVTKNQIAHLAISSSLLDVRNRRGADIDSDHHLVVAEVRLKNKKHSTRNTRIIVSVLRPDDQVKLAVNMVTLTGTLLAYTLVSSCVLVLRYQPHYTNLIELLPQSLRTPVDPEGTAAAQRETSLAGRGNTQITASNQRVMIRRVTRSSPDSDDTMPGDDSEEFGRDDTFLMNSHTENKFYGAVPGGVASSPGRFRRFMDAVSRQLLARSYLCPGVFPWVDAGPATDHTGMFVIKAVGVMYLLILVFDMLAAYGSPGTSTFTVLLMVVLMLAIFIILLLISRKPQNRAQLVYSTPALPFVPATAIIVNIYLILNLSILTLVRFTVWMIIGLVVYFKYGIKNSLLETKTEEPAVSPPTPSPLDRTTLPPPAPVQPRPLGDRNIFEGDGNSGLYGNLDFPDPLLAWHTADLEPAPPAGSIRPASAYKQVESRYNAKTNSTSSHTSTRVPWAYTSQPDLDPWDN